LLFHNLTKTVPEFSRGVIFCPEGAQAHKSQFTVGQMYGLHIYSSIFAGGKGKLSKNKRYQLCLFEFVLVNTT